MSATALPTTPVRRPRTPLPRGGMRRLARADLAALEVAGVLAVAGILAGGTWRAGLLATGGLLAVATVLPVRGRPPLRWARPLGAYAARRAAGATAYRAAEPARAAGLTGPDGGLPPALHGLRTVAVRPPGVDTGTPGEVGVAVDPYAGTATAVCAVAPGAPPLPAAEGSRAWAALLAALPGSPVLRVQWVRRARRTRDGEREETLVAVQTAATRGRRAVQRAGGGESGAAAVCAAELSRLAAVLGAQGVTVLGALSPGQLVDALARSFAPARAVPPADADLRLAGPVAAEESWSAYRSDDAWHATYWVSGWPSDPGAALEAVSTVAATVSVTATPRQDGRTDVHGLVAVTAPTAAELQRAGVHLERRAVRAGVGLIRLYGEQEQAFAATLPLARGGA